MILLRTPYNKVRADSVCMLHPSWLARRGYAVVVQDCRGRWRSDGEFVPFATEAADTEDTIAWAADAVFSNGRVGMYGFSYPGAVQLQGAVRRPPGLAALCPAMTSGDFYEGWTYVNGALSLAFAASWALYLAGDIARRRGDRELEAKIAMQSLAHGALYSTLPLGSLPFLGRGEAGGFFAEWLAHETKDDYWQRLDVEPHLDRIDAAVLAIGGLYDCFLEGTVRAFRGVRAGMRGPDARLVLGPWYHMPWTSAFGARDFGPDARNRVNELQLAFFDRWLRDEDAPDEPTVRAFVTGGDTWETFDDWPPKTEPCTLYLRARSYANSLAGDGFLSDEPPGAEDPDVFTYDPAEPVTSVGGKSCCYEWAAPMGPADQRPVEALNDVLVYTSPRLDRDQLVVGEIRARLYVSTSAPDTDWTIKVCDVDAEGRSVNVQQSIQRARFAAGTDAPRPISAGDVALLEFGVGTCAHLFRVGHRIRVTVTSSDFPHWDRNLNTGNPIGTDTLADRVVATQTLFHQADCPSAVILPVLDT